MRPLSWLRALMPAAITVVAIAAIMTLPDQGLGTDERPQVEGYRGRIVAVVPRPEVPDIPIVLPSGDLVTDFDPGAPGIPDDGSGEADGDFQVLLLDGPRAGEVVSAYLGTASLATRVEDFAVGDEVVVSFTGQPDGAPFISVSDRYRLPSLAILLLVFVVAVLIVGRGQGLRALIALGLTVALVLKIVIPQVLTGTPPVPLALIVASLVTVATIGLTEGFRRPGVAAILGTICALAIVGVSSAVMTEVARFSASGSDDFLFLWSALGGTLDIRGLLLAAFILGALGVLDDVTVTQAVTVEELSAGRDGLRGRALWSSALRVGRSHIGATVNTLFLAYVGASLPLVVLFVYAGRPATLVLNSEVVAIEVVRTLCGGLGIVAAVPITTAIATFLVGRSRPDRAGPDIWTSVGDPALLHSEVTLLPRASSGPRPRSGATAGRDVGPSD